MATAYAEYSRPSDESQPGSDAASSMVSQSGFPQHLGSFEEAPQLSEDICYYRNAATCPDCGMGMVRLGMCFSCQGCGFQSCGG